MRMTFTFRQLFYVDDPFSQYPRRGGSRGRDRALACPGHGDCLSGYLAVVHSRPAAPPPSLNVRADLGLAWLADLGLPRAARARPRRCQQDIETLNLVRVGADSSHWSRVSPTPETTSRRAGTVDGFGRQVVGRPASWFDWCDDADPLTAHDARATSNGNPRAVRSSSQDDEAPSHGRRASPLADRRRPGARRSRRAAVGALAAYAAVCVTVIATVIASPERDGPAGRAQRVVWP